MIDIALGSVMKLEISQVELGLIDRQGRLISDGWMSAQFGSLTLRPTVARHYVEKCMKTRDVTRDISVTKTTTKTKITGVRFMIAPPERQLREVANLFHCVVLSSTIAASV